MRAAIFPMFLLAVVATSTGCAHGESPPPAPPAALAPRHGGVVASSEDRAVEVSRTPSEIRVYFYRADGTPIPPKEAGYARVRWTLPEGRGAIDVLQPRGDALIARNNISSNEIEITTRGGGTRRFRVRLSAPIPEGGSP